ncbi:MAG TPA: hypothetical protein VHK88_03865, partial [Aquihabitans sp.]|nr:hypothetical protein [Aquihabitans sp.]
MGTERLHEGDPSDDPQGGAGQVSDAYADDLAALHRVATLPPGDPEDRLAQWLEAGSAALGAPFGVVLLGAEGETTVRAAVGAGLDHLVASTSVVDHRVLEAIRRRATVAVLGGTSTTEAPADLGAGAVVASPLWLSGEVRGAIAFVAGRDQAPYAAWSLALIDVVADGVARVLEHQADTRLLDRARSRSEAMIDLVPDPIVRLDAEGRRIGGPAGAVPFDPFEAISHGGPVDAAVVERLQLAIGRALATGTLHTAVLAAGLGPMARRVEARIVPAGPAEVLCIVRDVTDRHRAEQALAEQVAFEALVTSISTRLISCTPATLDGAIEVALGEIASFFAADTAFIDELSADGSALHVTHRWTRAGLDPSAQAGGDVSLDAFGWLASRFERVGHVVTRAPRHLPEDHAALDLAGPDDLGVLWVRLGPARDLAGVLGLAWRTQGPPASEDVLGLVR